MLSIGKGLSIQAHPNKKLAEQLHAARPDVYKDGNHKPEMAIAVTDFEAMCNFRPAEQVVRFIAAVPELARLMGSAGVDLLAAAVLASASPDQDEAVKAALREAFSKWATADGAQVATEVAALIARLETEGCETKDDADLTFANVLAQRLDHQFPGGDVGVFSPYLLNCLKLKPGEALFLAADEPHAYLSGDIFECMACSDNVVRMGCTPKLRDTDTLCSMLTYQTGPARVLGGTADATVPAESGSVRLYQPLDDAVDEFQVERIEVIAGQTVTTPVLDAPSILVCCTAPDGVGQGTIAAIQETVGQVGQAERDVGAGKAVEMAGGTVFMQEAGTSLTIEAGSGGGNLVVFRACSRQPLGGGESKSA